MAKKAVKKKTVKKAPYHHSHQHHHASNNLLLVIAGGFIVLVVLIYLVASTNQMNRTASVPAMETIEEESENITTVTIENGSYSPATVTVKKGDSVMFVNNDTDTHTATARDGSFTTQNLAMDTTETIVFDTPGEFDYTCNFHPDMQGTIIVEE